ncbi:hypothetical protein [Paenibacillus polymyxa]|uniref:hypothetical protein n=1 Tax=Paenibacillus polymyxa TaxID=1406 RepID=UPI00234AA000|nr:hypothetical protein [Paenibacillus polymyxa]WCM60745.1 hypothetical protein OYT09_22775 [Paenibacillus polymyxa]
MSYGQIGLSHYHSWHVGETITSLISTSEGWSTTNAMVLAHAQRRWLLPSGCPERLSVFIRYTILLVCCNDTIRFNTIYNFLKLVFAAASPIPLDAPIKTTTLFSM